MKEKEVNKFLSDKFGYKCETWYAFKGQCELYESGSSNMSSASSQQYCKRIPKRTTTYKYGARSKDVYTKGDARPDYQLLSCHWKVCPKLKKLIKG